jgi:hypothetical protein
MRKTTGLIAALWLAFAGQAFAAAEDGRQAAALRLLEAMDMRVNLARTIDQVTLAEVDKNPKLEPFKGVMLEFMHKYMGYDSLKNDLAKIYADAFNLAELDELSRFYQTPVGRKTLQMLPELTVQGGRMGERKVQEHLGELEAMISKEAQRLQAQQKK